MFCTTADMSWVSLKREHYCLICPGQGTGSCVAQLCPALRHSNTRGGAALIFIQYKYFHNLQNSSNTFIWGNTKIKEILLIPLSFRYRTENKDIQALSHLEEEEAKICAKGLTAGFTQRSR